MLLEMLHKSTREPNRPHQICGDCGRDQLVADATPLSPRVDGVIDQRAELLLRDGLSGECDDVCYLMGA
jgi:hypothetical protein